MQRTFALLRDGDSCQRLSTLTAWRELHQPLCLTFVVCLLTTISHSAWANADALKACTLIDWNSERLANILSSRMKIIYNYLFYATSCHPNCGCISVGSFINSWKSPVEFLPFSVSGPLKGQYKWEAQDRCYELWSQLLEIEAPLSWSSGRLMFTAVPNVIKHSCH